MMLQLYQMNWLIVVSVNVLTVMNELWIYWDIVITYFVILILITPAVVYFMLVVYRSSTLATSVFFNDIYLYSRHNGTSHSLDTE
jgi:hypothetical protein